MKWPIRPRASQVLVFEQIDFLVFQRFDEALSLGLVVGVAGSAHADPDPMRLEQVRLRVGGVLDPPIGVVGQVRPNAARCQSHSAGLALGVPFADPSRA
jgi:hypothetical protein